MILSLVIAISCSYLAVGVLVWFLAKDRGYWRREYQTRDRAAREREEHLFDQLLRLKGFRSTNESNMPQPAIARPASLSSEDLAIIDDRINERVEAGIFTPSEGWMLANDVREGRKTTGEVDRILWQRQQKEYPGSVFEDI